jgi:hypothetical protein
MPATMVPSCAQAGDAASMATATRAAAPPPRNPRLVAIVQAPSFQRLKRYSARMIGIDRWGCQVTK